MRGEGKQSKAKREERRKEREEREYNDGPSPGPPHASAWPRPAQSPWQRRGRRGAAQHRVLSPERGRHVAGVSSTGTWKAWGAPVLGVKVLKGRSTIICQAVEAGMAATSGRGSSAIQPHPVSCIEMLHSVCLSLRLLFSHLLQHREELHMSCAGIWTCWIY